MRNTRLVYSTEQGRVGKTEARPASLSPVPKDGILRIFRERAGHGGKTVTVIRGLPLRGAAIDALAAELRRLCDAGGAVKDDAIELQGDHRDRLAARLGELGYRVKLAGG